VGAGHERLAEDITIGRTFGGSRRAVEGDHRWSGQEGRGARVIHRRWIALEGYDAP
jgi:hypothetical protein